MSGEMTAMAPSGSACASVPADGEGSFVGMADDPAATAASNNPVLSTLVTAVTQAGLVDTLNGPGPFTIFAPTNDAFAAVPAADLEAVLADNDLLTSVLTYHVVAGEAMSSADLIAAGSVETVNGGTLEITDVDGTLTVNGIPTRLHGRPHGQRHGPHHRRGAAPRLIPPPAPGGTWCERSWA